MVWWLMLTRKKKILYFETSNFNRCHHHKKKLLPRKFIACYHTYIYTARMIEWMICIGLRFIVEFRQNMHPIIYIWESYVLIYRMVWFFSFFFNISLFIDIKQPKGAKKKTKIKIKYSKGGTWENYPLIIVASHCNIK